MMYSYKRTASHVSRSIFLSIVSSNLRLVSTTGAALKCSPRKYCHQAAKTGVVYESTSDDIFTNLAFEDWLYEKLDFSQTNLLLLWRNKPCVVIGRHQNPWAECQLRQLWGSEVKLARRRSGGGTVYHDLGNINFSFFTSRSSYNRKANLECITSGLKTRWPSLDVTVSCRDDILLNDYYKISGSAAKLGRLVSYHHFTLLHNVHKENLKRFLHFEKEGITHRATTSVRSAVRNLADVEPLVDHASLVNIAAESFYEKYPPLYEKKVYPADASSETHWPGVLSMKQELMTWDWVYGKTPQFSVRRSHDDVSILVHIRHAHIMGVVLQAPDGWLDIGLVQMLTDKFSGIRFWPSDVAMATEAYLGSVAAGPDTRRKLKLVCSLVEDAIS